MLYPISVAPMMGYTNRHLRYLLRILDPSLELYTEMIVANALLHGNATRLLQFHSKENPLVLQLGGSNPNDLAAAVKVAQQAGFTNFNLNVGCPSSRVQEHKIGACLMREPQLVAQCIEQVRQQTGVTLGIKTRIGIDDLESYDFFQGVIATWRAAGCSEFIIHARKAWLKGVSPRDNRKIPALNYDYVYRVKQENPNLRIVLNGGVQTVAAVQQHLQQVDGVMLGRVVLNNCYILAEIAHAISGRALILRQEIVNSYLAYVQHELAQGARAQLLLAPLMSLFYNQSNAKLWRITLANNFKETNFNIIQSQLVNLLQKVEHELE